MTNRKNFTTGAPWESKVGYSRAVKVGNLIEISGTTAVKNGEIVHSDNAYLQTKVIIDIANKVLEEAGGSLTDVVRTRMYITNIKFWEDVAKAHGEAFAEIKPATTLVEIKGLVDEKMLVEIEFTAILNP